MSNLPHIRFVVSDVDGTLVDGDKQLRPATIAAVGRLRAAGVPFSVISARPKSGLMPIIDALDLDEPVGAFNGGLVFQRDGTELHHDLIPEAVAHGILALAAGKAVDRWLFADGQWYASSTEGTHVEHERLASNQEPAIAEDLAPLLTRADKIVFVSDDADMLKTLAGEAIAAFGEQATIGQSQTYYLDVTAPTGNKGDGVAALASAADISLDETAVFGDQFNDLPMFHRAGWSAAMAQGPAEVRSQASYVSASNDDDGVAQAIDTVLAARDGAG